MYLEVKKFRYFVEGRKFAICTDHKPLTFVFNKVSDKWSPRQQRHIGVVSESTTDIRYVPGPDSVAWQMHFPERLRKNPVPSQAWRMVY